MATRAGFKRLADKLINKTFADFRDDIVFTLEQYNYDTGSEVIESVTTKGIRLNYSKGEFQNQAIQTGDYKVICYKPDIDFDIKTDNVGMTLNGVELDIESVIEDTAGATYTIQARAK